MGSRTHARVLWQSALLVLPLPLAIWAQWALSAERLALDGVVLFAVAIGLFLLFVAPAQQLRVHSEDDKAGSPRALRWSRVRAPLAFAVACAVLTWLLSEGNRFRTETLLFWGLAVGFYVIALWERAPTAFSSPMARFPRLSRDTVAISWSAFGLLLMVAVAAFFRFYQIGSVPAEMTSDHAEKLLDIRDVMMGEHRIFFPRNTGREPLQFYMAVPFVWLVGLNHLALKLVSATVSLATIPVVYLIGREMSGARFGLLAAALLAISSWDVTIGRVGLRFPFYPFFTALSFYFLLRAMKSGRRNDYLLCGITTGIGLYGYSPFRVMLVIIAASLMVKATFELRSGLRGILPIVEGGVLSLGAIAVVLTPLAQFVSEDPEAFWSRAATRLGDGETLAGTDTFQVPIGEYQRRAADVQLERGRGLGQHCAVRPNPGLRHWRIVCPWSRVGRPRYGTVRGEGAGLPSAGPGLASMLPSVLSIAFPGRKPQRRAQWRGRSVRCPAGRGAATPDCSRVERNSGQPGAAGSSRR